MPIQLSEGRKRSSIIDCHEQGNEFFFILVENFHSLIEYLCRRISENVFGIIAKRFEVLMSPILQKYENAIATCMACVVLHNYLREKMPEEDLQQEDLETEVWF